MDLRFTAEDEAFRQEVREFVHAHLPPEIADDSRRWVNPRVRTGAAGKKSSRTKAGAHRTGRLRWGGTDWSPLRKHIFFEELYRANAPDFGWQGTHMMAPVLFAFGTEEQCARFVPKMLTGEEFWCQGFSEPGAGSDLASLKTSAELVGDEWVINGQKIWTSDAAHAEWGFFLVRTDHDGEAAARFVVHRRRGWIHPGSRSARSHRSMAGASSTRCSSTMSVFRGTN